ncbi:MAG: hypothetical protein VCA55_13015 [Verrucomicrobiales bacterium]
MVHVFLPLCVLLFGESLRAADVEDLPIEVIEALEELLPGFDQSKITGVNVNSKELIKVEYLAGEQLIEFSLSNTGRLLWMNRNLPGHHNGLLIEERSGIEIGRGRLPARVLHTVRRMFPEIRIHKILILEERSHRRKIFRIEAENLGAELVMLVDERGVLIAFSLDSDSDGLCDVIELENGWDPNAADSDKDGFPDGIENDFGGNPNDAGLIPTLLKLCYDCKNKVIVITAQTFRGSEFFLEVSTTATPGDWVRMGEAISGDGEAHDFSIPSDGYSRMALFRLGIITQEGGAKARKDDGADDSGDCLVPDSLIGREISVGAGKHLYFTAPNRAELIEETGKEMMVMPCAFTFRKSGHCKARVVLTFSVPTGYQTTVYRLTFTADGDSGIFAASEYEKGQIEDRFDGTFTITMNP